MMLLFVWVSFWLVLEGTFFSFLLLQLLFVAGHAGPVTVGKKREMNRKREEIRSGGLL
jgi:hypothetical protein